MLVGAPNLPKDKKFSIFLDTGSDSMNLDGKEHGLVLHHDRWGNRKALRSVAGVEQVTQNRRNDLAPGSRGQVPESRTQGRRSRWMGWQRIPRTHETQRGTEQTFLVPKEFSSLTTPVSLLLLGHWPLSPGTLFLPSSLSFVS